MKKAWKWALVVLGVPALSIVVLWVDSYYRAVAAIRAEDARLAKDIAAFRARLKPLIPVDGAYLAGSAAAPHSFHHQPDPWKLEDGRSGNPQFKMALNRDLYGLSTISPDLRAPEVVPPGDAVFSNLALTFRTIRQCGFVSRELGTRFETGALHKLQPIIAAADRPAEIRRIAEQLDRLLAARPPLADALEAQHLMDRAEVLRVLHRKADPTGMILRPPGWKEFFSWRILLVNCLHQLDDDLAVRRRDPSADPKFEPRSELTRSLLRASTFPWQWEERLLLDWWTLARVAAALALFRAERGREPEKLDQLVPDYLPKLPTPTVHGDALHFREGILWARVEEKFSLEWSIRRP